MPENTQKIQIILRKGGANTVCVATLFDSNFVARTWLDFGDADGLKRAIQTANEQAKTANDAYVKSLNAMPY